MKIALYLFPSLIWPKVVPADLLGVVELLVKSARFWGKIAVGSSCFVT